MNGLFNLAFQRVATVGIKCCFFTICIALSINLSAQVHGITAEYKAYSYDDYMKPILEYQRSYDQMLTSINELTSYIVDILGRDIDSQLREEMNQEFKNIERVAKDLTETGKIGNARAGYNSIYRNVQKDIANYNNRVSFARKAAEEIEAEARARAAQEAATPQSWSGSGFALKDGYIVTNYHVVEGASRIRVKGIKGDFSTFYNATVVASDPKTDLAIISVDDYSFSGFGNIPYSIKGSSSEVGEEVFVLGYPLTATMGDEIKYTTGVISSKSGFQGDYSQYQISAPVQPGNSGGPLFDNRGNLIGIVSAKHVGAENVGYAIKSYNLSYLVDNKLNRSVLPTSNSISSFERVSQIKAIRNFVFIIECARSINSHYFSPNDSREYDASYSKGKTGAISSLNRREITLSVGDSFQIIAYPSDITITECNSDNPRVATVSNSGKVYAIGRGKTNVWVYSGASLKLCKVTVN